MADTSTPSHWEPLNRPLSTNVILLTDLLTPSQTTLVITGENFIATPSVSLNEIALTDVHIVNATTLIASLPATLTAGVYDVLVSNPNGQSNVLEAALIVRRKFFMPMVAKR